MYWCQPFRLFRVLLQRLERQGGLVLPNSILVCTRKEEVRHSLWFGSLHYEINIDQCFFTVPNAAFFWCVGWDMSSCTLCIEFPMMWCWRSFFLLCKWMIFWSKHLIDSFTMSLPLCFPFRPSHSHHEAKLKPFGEMLIFWKLGKSWKPYLFRRVYLDHVLSVFFLVFCWRWCYRCSYTLMRRLLWWSSWRR